MKFVSWQHGTTSASTDTAAAPATAGPSSNKQRPYTRVLAAMCIVITAAAAVVALTGSIHFQIHKLPFSAILWCQVSLFPLISVGIDTVSVSWQLNTTIAVAFILCESNNNARCVSFLFQQSAAAVAA